MAKAGESVGFNDCARLSAPRLRRRRSAQCPRYAMVADFGALSEPFKLPASFAPFGTNPPLIFSPSRAQDAARALGIQLPSHPPEIVGSLLWTAALYLGFSERVRWGTALNEKLRELLHKVLPSKIAESLSDSIHSLPFLFAGMAVDDLLMDSAGTSWALSTSLTASIWALVYELGRRDSERRAASRASVQEEEMEMWGDFVKFADRNLQRSGRCHFIDIDTEFRRQYPKYRTQATLSDEQVRRFVKQWAPTCSRTQNGFYKNLSISRKPDQSVA